MSRNSKSKELNWDFLSQYFEVDPSSAMLHYGQTIFEGIKAFKNDKGDVVIFRPDQNFKRFNILFKTNTFQL